MTNINIKELWENVKNYAYNVRKICITLNNDKLGQDMWKPLKENLSNYVFFISGKEEEKITVKPAIYDLFDYKFDKDDEDHNNSKATLNKSDIVLDNTVPIEHFLVQQLRISKMNNEKLIVVKFMQLAYNIGQFMAQREVKGSYDENLLKIYSEEELDDITSYLEDYKNYEIKNKQKGGNKVKGDNKVTLYKLTNFTL